VFSDEGYTKEEWKMINETKKILEVDIPIDVTCVRVPVVTGHSVAISAKFEKPVDLNLAKEALRTFPGIRYVDKQEEFITALEAAGKNDTFISRLRRPPNFSNTLNFWCVSDNLRKGAALNAIQIAQTLPGFSGVF
jgi:aspartate-semialdehyde dehydrogenase